jgi:ABC-2 type transport system permease protein
LRPLGTVRRHLVAKELRLFFRDTTQWSQLVLLGVMVVVYVLNVKLLPLGGDGVTFFIANVVPFLNIALAGFVLTSVAARFVFPAVSLEGRSWWLVRSAPLPIQDLLWAKFWTGTVPLLALALVIGTVTNTLLQVTAFMFVLSVMTLALLTLAVAALALALGSAYPRFEVENAAQIPTSFGGLVFMMAAVALVALVIAVEAGPVYSYLASRAAGRSAPLAEVTVGLGAAALILVSATLFPLRLAHQSLERLEH